MSLALAAVGGSQKASAAQFYYEENSTTSLGSPVLFNPTNGQIDAMLMPGDYQLLTDLEGFKTVARLNAFGSDEFAVAPFTSLASASSVANLSAAAPIGPFPTRKFATGASTLASNSAPNFGHFDPPPSSGYIGLEIHRNSQIYYGWANITVNADYTVTITGTGWDDSGGPINAGDGILQTPEPASIVLLALGAAGIAAYRRKQRV